MSLESQEQHVLGVAGDIEKTAKEVRGLRQNLRSAGRGAAKAIAEYEKELAVTIVKLRNGRAIEFEGETVLNPPVTVMDKIAKGICHDKNLASQVASYEYSALTANLKAAIAELSAYQIKYRHLTE